MGIYLNPDSSKFEEAVNSDIYVDKTGLLVYTNSVLHTMQKYICVSRPRRFGKSTAANMLTAYYSRGCDAGQLFSRFEIAKNNGFKQYLNQYNTISVNMQEILSRSHSIYELIERFSKLVIRDLKKEYPDVDYFDDTDVIECMQDVYSQKKQAFIVILDEWDCIFREYKEDKAAQEKYLDFLRDMLKDKAYIHLAYMTGILPIKKYGTHSALNMFDEFSMIDPGPLAEFVGFTEAEVKMLCEQYQMDMTEVKCWYDGYSFENGISIYSPRSVVSCMRFKKIGNYWNQTETFEALRIYIDMNFEGLKDDVLSMIAGNTVPVNIGNFSNDMSTFHSEDDVLTLLIHLGYVSYDYDSKTVKIPNENALSYTISLALYAARNFYVIHRELASGKGFADLVFVPRKKFPEKPAIVVELKWDKDADGAIAQIKNKEYCRSLEEYRGNVLLVGVNYNKKTKVHECVIEEDVIGTEMV